MGAVADALLRKVRVAAESDTFDATSLVRLADAMETCDAVADLLSRRALGRCEAESERARVLRRAAIILSVTMANLHEEG